MGCDLSPCEPEAWEAGAQLGTCQRSFLRGRERFSQEAACISRSTASDVMGLLVFAHGVVRDPIAK